MSEIHFTGRSKTSSRRDVWTKFKEVRKKFLPAMSNIFGSLWSTEKNYGETENVIKKSFFAWKI